jgi:hypothetical protein
VCRSRRRQSRVVTRPLHTPWARTTRGEETPAPRHLVSLPRRPFRFPACLLGRPSRLSDLAPSPALASRRPGARSHPGGKVVTTWEPVARAPLSLRLAATTSRGSALPRSGPPPPGTPRVPRLQSRRRAGQRFGGGSGRAGSEGGGGGGSSSCSPTLRRQAGGATEAGPQEVSARPGQQRGGSPSPRLSGAAGAGPGAGAGGAHWRPRRAPERKRGQLRAGHPPRAFHCCCGKVLFSPS